MIIVKKELLILKDNIKMKKQSEYKLYKELKREVVHKEWLLKNLPKSKTAYKAAVAVLIVLKRKA